MRLPLLVYGNGKECAMQKETKEKDFVRRPSYPGGPKAMQEFLRQHLQYPAEALQHGVEGTVVVRYEIDYKGNVTQVKVLTSVGYGCDEEAIRLVKMLKFDVPPVKGLKVSFHNTLKVHFRLPASDAPAELPAAPAIVYSVTPASTNAPEAPTTNDNKQGSYTYTIHWQ